MSSRYPSTHQDSDSGSTLTADPYERGPLQDFAFADTVIADDLDVAPPSGIVVSEEHQVTQLSYGSGEDAYGQLQYDPQQQQQHHHQQYAFDPHQQMPPGSPYPMGAMCPLPPSWWARVRVGMQRSREEMTLLWSATANLERTHADDGTLIHEEDPFLRAAAVGRRVRTLWSFFEWDRADLVRAAWIGLAVFVLAATVGAFILGSSSEHASTDQQQQQLDSDNATYTSR